MKASKKSAPQKSGTMSRLFSPKALIGLAVIVLLAGAAIVWRWQQSAGPDQLAGSPAVLSQGQALYTANCAACHGAALEGQENWQERRADGRLPAPPHDESGHTWHHPDALLFAVTKYGTEALAGGDYKSDMTGFEGILSDAEIIAILTYIKSTWPPEIQARQADISRRANAQTGG